MIYRSRFSIVLACSLGFAIWVSLCSFDHNQRGVAVADSQPSTILLFKKIVTANNGSNYLVGEVQNNETSRNIESVAYFSKSDLTDSYYSQEIGVIPTGMGIPFKIGLREVEKPNSSFNLSDFRIDSRYTPEETNNLLAVNYSSMHTDPLSHVISGMVDNKSPINATDVRVLAIALDSHSKPLDVVESDIIPRIPPNSSSFFKLVPIDSIARNVSLYSCFVPTAAGLNYTIHTGNGQNIQLLFDGDGKMKNLKFDPQNRTLTFTAQGIFPGGGTEEAMIMSGPDSFIKSSLILTVNGRNITNGVSGQIVGDHVYKHLEFSFPFGYNRVTVQSVSAVPEFPLSQLIMIASIGLVLALGTIVARKNDFRGFKLHR